MKAGTRWALHDVWDGLRGQPARLGLSCLAIGVGIAALTILLAVLNGLEARSRAIVQELGVNVFAILPPRDGHRQTGPVLTQERVAALRANLPTCRFAAVFQDSVFIPALNRQVQVIATEPDLAAVRGWELRSGRFIDPADAPARVAVISAVLADSRQWRPGQVFVLDETPYDIIGIVDAGGAVADTDMPDAGRMGGQEAVFLPLDTPAYWFTHAGALPLHAVFVRTPDGEDLDRYVYRTRQLLASFDGEALTYGFLTPDQLLQRIRRLRNTLRFTVGSIAFLCLMLGGTTLMSLMVANVRDRLPEIGLRRALGASKQEVASLFVVEAALVSCVAATVASAGTNAVLWLARGRFPAPLAIGWPTLLVPLLVAVGLGMLFSYWPARIAAGISPAEALRNY